MATIKAPNRVYNGVSAGVQFSGGEGATDNPAAIAWFRVHGYEVIEDIPPAETEDIPPAETENIPPVETENIPPAKPAGKRTGK